MDSFEYLTNTSDYVDTFSFIDSNTEEQDQFMQCIDDMESSKSTCNYSLMGLMLNNAGNSVHVLKSAINAAHNKDNMGTEQESVEFVNHTTKDSSDDEMLLPPEFNYTEHDIATPTLSTSTHDITVKGDDMDYTVEHRVERLMKMMDDDTPTAPSLAPMDENVAHRDNNNSDVPLTDQTEYGHRDEHQQKQQQEDQQQEQDKNNDDSANEDKTEKNDDEKENDDKDNDEQSNQEFDEQYLKDRAWTILSNLRKKSGNKVVTVEIKTRSDKAQHVIPDRLYSSLKYEFRQCVSPGLRMSNTGVMMCKMEIVNPKDPSEELLKANGDRLVRGVQDFTAITMNNQQTALEVKNKFQFTGVSYHHDKKYFAMKLSYYDPSFDMSKPVFSMVSAPFQVFARRPTMRAGATGSNANIVASSGDEEEKQQQTIAKKSTEKAKRTRKQKQTKNVEKMIISRKSTNGSSASSAKRKSSSLSIEIPDGEQAASFSFNAAAKRLKFYEDGEFNAKHNLDVQEIDAAISGTQDTAFANYMNCLDLLVGFKDNLRSEEQKLALEIAHAKLFPEAQSNNDQHSPLPQDILATENSQESSLYFSS